MAHSRETRNTQPNSRRRTARSLAPAGVLVAAAALSCVATGRAVADEPTPPTSVPTSTPSWSAQVIPTDQVAQTVAAQSKARTGVTAGDATGTPGSAPATTTPSAPSTSVASSKVVAPKAKKTKAKASPDTTVPVVAAAAATNVVLVAAAADPTAADGPWAALRKCESGGRYDLNTGNGYYGAYQFSLTTWQKLGFSGYPHQAAPAVQDAAAKKLQAKAGWGQWPACAAKLGLR